MARGKGARLERPRFLLVPPNGLPLSCDRAKSYHAQCRATPPTRLKPAAVGFSGLLDGLLAPLTKAPATRETERLPRTSSRAA